MKSVTCIQSSPEEFFQSENILLDSAWPLAIGPGFERVVSPISFSYYRLQIPHRFFNLVTDSISGLLQQIHGALSIPYPIVLGRGTVRIQLRIRVPLSTAYFAPSAERTTIYANRCSILSANRLFAMPGPIESHFLPSSLECRRIPSNHFVALCCGFELRTICLQSSM